MNHDDVAWLDNVYEDDNGVLCVKKSGYRGKIRGIQ